MPSPTQNPGAVRQLMVVASLWIGAAGCGGEAATSTIDPLDTTTTVADSSTTGEDDSTLSGAVAAGDVCALHDAIGSSGFVGGAEPADETDALRLFADSAAELSTSDAVDPAIRPALRTLSDQAAALADAIDANGGDMDAPDVVELQRSADAQSAYDDYGEWIDRNCTAEPSG